MQRGLLAALAALGLLVVAGGTALAQSPPMRTFGTATVDGQPAPAGTVVEVLVGEKVCGEGSVRRINDDLPLGYVVDVISASTTPGCAAEGEQVRFRVGGRVARETAPFETGSFLRLDLTATGQVQTPTPGAATPPPFGSTTPTPAATFPTGTGTAAAGSATPAGSATASATATAEGSSAAGSPTVSPTSTLSPTSSGTVTPRSTALPRTTPVASSGNDDDGGSSSAAIALIAGLIVAGLAAAGFVLFRRSRAG